MAGAMPHKPSLSGLPHVKTVIRRGKEYHYFNTGQRVNGKPVRIPLPAKDDPNFGRAYATAKANRTKRANSPHIMTVPQLVRMWERGPMARKSLSTQKTYGVYLRQIEALFEDAPAIGVEERDIYRMMDSKADTPTAAQMIFVVARMVFRWAKKRRYVAVDPTADVELDDYQGGEHEPWPEHLIEEALKDDLIRLPVALMYYTAQRIGDCCDMRWSDIRDGVLHITQQKTGKALEIPLHSSLLAILERAPRHGLTILADAKGRKGKHSTIRTRIQKFAAKQGFKVVPHGLRKNAVNALLEAECSTAETSAISGQSLRLVEFYAKKRNTGRLAGAAILKWQRNGEVKS
jgi:integrase